MKTKFLSTIIAALLAVSTAITLASCGSVPAGTDAPAPVAEAAVTDLLANIDVDRAPMTALTDEQAKTLTAAYLKLFKNTLSDKKGSSLISPFSIIAALGMTADGTAGDTLAQLESLFGVSAGALDALMPAVLSKLTDTGSENVTFSNANSLWLTNDGSVKFRTSYLERVKAAYDPAVYATDFSDPAISDVINAWVKENTGGMIEKIIEPSDVGPMTVAALVNAIAFEAQWEEKFSGTSNGTFTSYAGEKQAVEMMKSTESSYCSLKNASGFSKDYAGGKYKFVALLPDEGIDVFEFIETLDEGTLRDVLKYPTEAQVSISMPKFTFDYDLDLIPSLVSLGVTDLFGPADFSAMAEIGKGDIYVDKAIHKTHIEVDENGTKAAAATYIGTRKNAVVSEYTVTLDRPFVYMIVDSGTSLPVFMGVMASAK